MNEYAIHIDKEQRVTINLNNMMTNQESEFIILATIECNNQEEYYLLADMNESLLVTKHVVYAGNNYQLRLSEKELTGINELLGNISGKKIVTTEGSFIQKGTVWLGVGSLNEVRRAESEEQKRNEYFKDEEDVTIPENAYIDEYGALYDGDGEHPWILLRVPKGISSFAIPESCFMVRSNAFYECNLEQVFIPDNVSGIEENAISYCSCKTIRLPRLATLIYYDDKKERKMDQLTKDNVERVFTCCKRLKDICIGKDVVSIR